MKEVKGIPISLCTAKPHFSIGNIIKEAGLDNYHIIHPVANPLKFGIITAPGISKQEGAIEISKNIKIPLENILAVGDSTSDWQFIKMCGYGAAMQNASDKLKELVQTKGANHFKISQKSVDENGIIEILDYFCK